MIANISKSLKDRTQAGKWISIFFFIGIVVSCLVLFMLPHNLVYKGQVSSVDGAWSVLTQLYLVIGFTFLIGVGAIIVSLFTKKETIVYLEKRKDGKSSTDAAGTDQSENTDIIKAFKSSTDQVKNQKDFIQQGLNFLCKQLDAGQGAIYVTRKEDDKRFLELHSGYALNMGESNKVKFEFGEGLVGQAALTGNSLYIDDIPEGYITVLSGLGNASPKFLMLIAVKKEGETKGIVELATFSPITGNTRKQIDEIATLLADKIS
jgi:hypothetical protein